MIVYLAEKHSQDKLDALKESQIINTEVKEQISQKEFMNFIKRELRNIEIDCLVIDTEIFDQSEDLRIDDAIDAFLLLSPDSKVIIIWPDLDLGQDREDMLQKNPNVFYVPNTGNPVKYIDRILKEESDLTPESEEKPSCDGQENGDPEILKNIENRYLDYEYTDVEEVVPAVMTSALVSDNQSRESDDQNEKHRIIPDDIYKKASVPVKTSEGVPLRKKIRKMQEKSHEEDPDQVKIDTEKLSGKVKRLQRETEDKITVAPAWSCSNIMIGVVGTERRTGTTTAAMELARYLHNAGASVIYSEANRHNHLPDIALWLNFEKEEDHYIKDDIRYYPASQFDQELGANFIILDLGDINDNKDRALKIMASVDEIIIVSGSKLYERRMLNASMQDFQKLPINILFNMTSEKNIPDLMKLYGAYVKMVLTLEYIDKPDCRNEIRFSTPNMFTPYMKKHQAS